ncbi:protein bric-a-brac 2 isoform X2 [Drosophila bipectinata]|uniref:protein bric-a-brac 2 isoform X2 n=1 Tax=Drosophila bipectinata TaxID=42026 RepID=UPI001C890339|nr:protein bric-a-brac 2 isoform X2 [Drosophila bipectinata]
MSVQQFCLRWNNHQPNFISVCSSLLHNGTLVDVTLAAEGRQLQAHKIVLSACSSYFQALFTTNPCQHPIVILKDVQYDDLKTMVDFMYYGEVNVSQEQLPHILKTAEMLKIKGLAEMPTDPANLTKSDSKSSTDGTELVGGGSGVGAGPGTSAGSLGAASGSSVGDSLWSSSEAQQFQQQQQQQQQAQQQQQQQHHHHQQQQQLQQQQQQQAQQQQQQQHHHHHQQQAQTAQAHHHQMRRTPSPLSAGTSPATRRKRLRKSSNNGSGERNNVAEEHNSSLETGAGNAGLSLAQMSQMSFGAGGGLAGHSLHAAKLLKESAAAELEQQPQDSDLDDGHGHIHMQIKPEVDIGGVNQAMPLDISGATTPSEHDAPNSQSSHSGLQWTVVDSNYPRFSLPACQSNLLGNGGGGGGSGSQSSGANSANSDQRQQQHEAQQQAAANQQQQQQHLQQLHYQQQQQQQQQQEQASASATAGQAYSSQIITVNSLVSGYATTAQNLSPTSPNESNMVQSVYSQGPTPTQSPVHAGTGGSGGNGNATGNGGTAGAASQVVKRKRSVNPQGDENFIRALEAVRTGGIGFCKAARLYGVNNRTLWLEYKKRGYPVSRPSIKARVVKQEPNLSPSPTPSTNPGDDNTNETLSMQIPPQAETPTPSLMCTPHHTGIGSAAGSLPGSGNSHPAIGVMSLFDPRYMDSPGTVHSMTRQRYIDSGAGAGAGGAATGAGTGTINVNPSTAMNLQSINFNSI